MENLFGSVLQNSIDTQNDQGLTLLMIAARNGNSEFVAKLLLLKPNTWCVCLFFFAFASDLTRLKCGANYSSLHYAAMNGHEKIVLQLLNYSAENIDQPDNEGRTALHLACRNGFHRVTKAMLGGKYLPALNLPAEYGTCILHDVAQRGLTKVVIQLVKDPRLNVCSQFNFRFLHTQVNVLDHDSCNPLFYAYQFGFLHIVALIVTHASWKRSEVNYLCNNCMPLNNCEEVKRFLGRF